MADPPPPLGGVRGPGYGSKVPRRREALGVFPRGQVPSRPQGRLLQEVVDGVAAVQESTLPGNNGVETQTVHLRSKMC